MFRTLRLFLGICLIALISSCEPDLYPTRFASEEELASLEDATKFVDIPVVLDVEMGVDAESDTKATALSGVESIRSGVQILVFRSESKTLVSSKWFSAAEIAAASSSNPLIVQAPLTTCDFFILGNMMAVNKSSGAVVDLRSALGDSFPTHESDLEAFIYRFDGGNLNSTYRREQFSEVATYGIPYQRVEKNVNVVYLRQQGLGLPNADKCVYLFSKVNLTIDHSGLDGNGSNPGHFVNKKVIVRQVNCRTLPFSTTSVKAVESSDVIARPGSSDLADYDISMSSSNASSVTVSLFVPENMQGNLLSNGSGANLLKIPANVSSSVRDYVTYVEYQGSVASNAGGYGADVTYQFCLGSDAVNNFDLQRGKKYDVTLSLSVKNIFDQPAWKVGVSNWSDSRTFRLTSDSGFSNTLPEGQMVAIRSNRVGLVYVFSAKSSGLSNQLLGKSVADPSFSPSSLEDCAWTSDFLSASNSSSDVPSRAWLSERGITPTWDSSSGALRFSVTDVSKFNSHIGEEKVLTLRLLPGGDKSVSLKVKLYPDISITWDNSLTEHFLPGMKRTATVSGFSGEVQYKVSDAHMYKNQVATGGTGLISSSYSASQQIGNGTFPIWCYYCCNDNLMLTFSFLPLDSFNDGGELSYSIRSRVPSITIDQSYFYLEVTGKEEVMSWRIREGSSSGTVIARSAFDDAAFAHVYPMTFGYGNAGTEYHETTAGDYTVYDPSSNDILGVSYKGSYNSDGYPDLYIYRKVIGTEYDVRADRDVRLRNAFLYCMPVVSGSYSGRMARATSLDIRLLPFVSSSVDLGFASKYDDYTLTPGSERFDEPYRSYATNSISFSSASKATFYCTERSQFKLYAAAVYDYEVYSGEPSESVIISQDTDGGPLVVSLVNETSSYGIGGNYHSAGPHNVYASVTNKHSGETLEVLMGSFDVYVHFIVGAEYFTYDVRHTGGYVVFLDPDAYFGGRTDFEADLWNTYVKMTNGPSFIYDEGFGGGFDASLTENGGIRRYSPCVAKVGFDSDRGSYEGSCSLFITDFYAREGHSLDEYYWMIVGDDGGPASLAENTHASIEMKFTSSNNYSVSESVMYYSVDDHVDSDGHGYYVMHMLRDVSSESRGWRNVFYDYE